MYNQLTKIKDNDKYKSNKESKKEKKERRKIEGNTLKVIGVFQQKLYTSLKGLA